MTTTPQKQGAMIPKERLLHQIQRSPFVDWVIILGVCTILFLILVGVGVSVYLDTRDQLLAPSSETSRSAKQPLNAASLQNVLAGFDARATERTALQQGYSAPQDPSLP